MSTPIYEENGKKDVQQMKTVPLDVLSSVFFYFCICRIVHGRLAHMGVGAQSFYESRWTLQKDGGFPFPQFTGL